MIVKEILGWVILALSLLNILAATLLFPFVRRFNHWSLGWLNQFFERPGLPNADLQKRLVEWWIAQEGLQRGAGIAMGLMLLVLWWFVWG